MSNPHNPNPPSLGQQQTPIDFKTTQVSSPVIIHRSPENNNTLTRDSTMATVECLLPENHSTVLPTHPQEQEEMDHIPSDRTQRSFDDENIFPEAQPSPHAVYKSTLANLSDGLATLNEGDYMQWSSCNNDQKGLQNIVLSQKSIASSGRRQRPVSVHMNAAPGLVNYHRTETPNRMNRSQNRSVINKANTKLVRNVVIGDIDIVYRRNYDSVVPLNQSRTNAGNDLRWKESGSMHQDLEILKTEETFETVKKFLNKEYIEVAPVVITNDKYQRSSSVKNRRPLTKEFEDWKVVLMQRKEALAEKKEQLKKEKAEKVVQQEVKKEDMVLPKLNIGGENIKSPTKRDKEKETQATNRMAGMRKTKLNWGGGRPATRGKSMNIHLKENRENVLDKSHTQKEVKDSGKQKNTPEIKSVLKSNGSASMVIWDEETLIQNILQRQGNDEGKQQNESENGNGQSNKWKQNVLMPKMKIKQDLIMKKQTTTFVIQKRVKSRAESRERSRERSAEVKYDADKVMKGHKENVNRMGMTGYYSCETSNTLTEAYSAQAILDQRLKTLEERYGRKEEATPVREQRQSLEHRRLSRNSLAGDQERSKSRGKEEGGKITKINFVMNLKRKSKGGI